MERYGQYDRSAGAAWEVVECTAEEDGVCQAIEMYWDRVQRVRDLLDLAEPRMKEEGVESAVRRGAVCVDV